MKRRDFSNGLLAASLAAPAILGPTSALANVNERDERDFESFVRMQLVLTSGTLLITWLLFMFPTVLGLNFQRNVPRYQLQRAALGVLMLGLMRKPFDKRFANSVLLGNVVLLSNMLLVLPLLTRPRGPSSVIVANDKYEFAHPGTPKSINIKGLPNRTRLDRLPVIGTARVNEANEVGLIIPPLTLKMKF